MKKLISSLDELIKIKRPEYYSELQPSVDAGLFAKFENTFEMDLPEDFKELYLWKNGQNPMSFDVIQGNRSFMSLEEVIRVKSMLDGMIGYDFDDPSYWRRGWVPFLHNGGGSYLCLDLQAESGGTSGQLIAFWKADKGRPVEHKSLRVWLNYLISGMKNGTLEFY